MKDFKFSPLMFSPVDLGLLLVGVITRYDLSYSLFFICFCLSKCRNMKEIISSFFFFFFLSSLGNVECGKTKHQISFLLSNLIFLIIVFLFLFLFGWGKNYRTRSIQVSETSWKKLTIHLFRVVCWNFISYFALLLEKFDGNRVEALFNVMFWLRTFKDMNSYQKLSNQTKRINSCQWKLNVNFIIWHVVDFEYSSKMCYFKFSHLNIEFPA